MSTNRGITKIKNWSNRSKVAALLLLLDEASASKVLKNFNDNSLVISIAKEIATIGSLGEDDQFKLLDEVYDILNVQVGKASGSLQKAENILTNAFGKDTAAGIIDRMTSKVNRIPFEFLKSVDPEQISSIIQGEHSQVIALVLSHLNVEKSSKVLQMMPENIRTDISLRLAKMDKTNPEILAVVEKTLEKRFASIMNQSQSSQNIGGIGSVAEILNKLDRNIERKILEDLEIIDMNLATDIRNLMFVFDDIAKLDNTAVQTIVSKIDIKDLPLALKGASEEMRELFYKNMSEKAAKLMRDDIEMMGPVPLKEVSSAQNNIVEQVKALDTAGEIVIRPDSGEEEMVE